MTKNDTKLRLTIPYLADETAIAEHREATYDQWRTRGPLLWADELRGIGGWLVTSYDACKFVAKEDSKLSKEFFRFVDTHAPEDVISFLKYSENDLFTRDDPTHARIRGLLAGEFNRDTQEKLRLQVNSVCDQLIPELQKRGEFDAVHDFAWHIASVILTDFIGFDPKDAWRFAAWSLDRQHFLPLLAPPYMIRHGGKSLAETDAFLRRIIGYRRRYPTDDLISVLVRKKDVGYDVSEDELLGTIRILGFAGYETTRDLLSGAILALLQHPIERDQLASNPSLLPNAMDELLRFITPDQMIQRIAIEDVEIEGHQIQAGDRVFAIIGAANRDPAVFPDPHRLDLKRTNASSHLAFAAGTHFCVGFAVAKVVVSTALMRLLEAMPSLCIDDGIIRWGESLQMRGLRSLPVKL